jgi:hypothetical protein
MIYPQCRIWKNLFLNAFTIPEIFFISHEGKVDTISNWCLGEGLVDDGLRMTDRSCMQLMDKAHKVVLNRRTNQIQSVACCQFIHRGKGAIVALLVVDENGLVILSCLL